MNETCAGIRSWAFNNSRQLVTVKSPPHTHTHTLSNTRTHILQATLYSGKLRPTEVTVPESKTNTNSGRKLQPKKCFHLPLNPSKGKKHELYTERGYAQVRLLRALELTGSSRVPAPRSCQLPCRCTSAVADNTVQKLQN